MAPIVVSVDVDRAAEDAFAFTTDPTQFAQWQRGVVSGHMDAQGATQVGTRCLTTRRIGWAERPVTAEVICLDPPRRWAVRGIDGPIRAHVEVEVRSLGAGRSRVQIAIDFTGHGIGRLLVPLVVRPGAQREMPQNVAALKECLERGSRKV